MLATPLHPSFLDAYSLSISSLGRKALCIVMSFHVLWSICGSCLFNLKNGPEYLTKGTVQLFIPFIRFLLYSLVSSSFLILLKYSFLILIFSFISAFFDGVRFQYSQIFVSFLFSEFSDFSWFCSSIPSSFAVFRFLFLTWHIFQYFSNSIPISWFYILTACSRVSNSFLFLANDFISSLYISCLIFSYK